MSVFDYRNYKEFLKAWCELPEAGKGIRGRLSTHLRCQPSFFSQVLNGKPDLSLEQAYRASSFFKFTDEETEYFLLLVQRAKASDHDLIRYFDSQIVARLSVRTKITSRVKAGVGLTLEQQTRYYSSWIYSAVHILAALSETNRREAIAKHLRVSRSRINAVIDFLISCGVLFEEPSGRLILGEVRMHLPQGSVMLPKHHENWRQRAVASMDEPGKDDLHYSLVMGLSEEDVMKVRDFVLDLISKTEAVLNESKEKKACVLGLDFFEI